MDFPGLSVVARHADGGRGVSAKAPAAQGQKAQPGYSRRPAWMLALPPLAALLLMFWRITRPSYNPDESATLSAVHRSLPQLMRMLGNIDAVHGPYYIAMWFYVHVAGTSELATRLPSALAMAVAAAVTAAIGRRLASPRGGLAAGLVFVALPEISVYAQYARPYAFTAAFGAVASYALVRVLTVSPERRTRWLVAYGICMALLGLSQVFALLLVLAHAVTVLLHLRAGRNEPATRSLAVGWLTAVVVAVAVCGPVLWLGYKQRSSLNTITHRPWPIRVEELFGSWLVVIVLTAVLACGIAAALVARHAMARSTIAARLSRAVPPFRGSPSRSARRSGWPASLVWLCVPWLVVPPAVLLIVSQVDPIYAARYVLFCLPAAALMMGAALDALGWVAGTAALTAIVLAGLPLQLSVRTATGHGRNIREVDQVIAANYQRGDAVLYGSPRAPYQQFAYPYGLAKLRDIGLAQTPAESGTLAGTTVNGGVVSNRLRDVQRVWLVGAGSISEMDAGIVTEEGFRLVHFWPIRADPVRLYARPRDSRQ